jgi:hypothetical protein
MAVCDKNRILRDETRDGGDSCRVRDAFKYVMHAFFIGALRYDFARFAESSGKAGSER